MNILMLIWRDIRNPTAGGAGRATHELCRRWVALGHTVTIFTSAFPQGREHEEIDGYQVIRKGSLFTHYYHAYKHYQKSFKGNYDVVIDQINTLPYFTPFYVNEAKIIVYIHQLCREIWFYEKPFPLSLIGYLSEPLYLKLYRHYPTITVSESTRQDLVSLGFSNVLITSNAVDVEPLSTLGEKEQEPTIIFVGRLKKAKRPHHVIIALSLIKRVVPNVKLWIVGKGNFKRGLVALSRKYRLEDNVIFFGWVSPQEKRKLMQRAHCICVPSVREGWGLIVTEANAVGTPAIAYKVPGLKDSIRHGENGLFTPQNNPQSLATTVIEFLQDQALIKELSASALKDSRRFDWDKSASEFLEILSSFRV